MLPYTLKYIVASRVTDWKKVFSVLLPSWRARYCNKASWLVKCLCGMLYFIFYVLIFCKKGRKEKALDLSQPINLSSSVEHKEKTMCVCNYENRPSVHRLAYKLACVSCMVYNGCNFGSSFQLLLISSSSPPSLTSLSLYSFSLFDANS